MQTKENVVISAQWSIGKLNKARWKWIPLMMNYFVNMWNEVLNCDKRLPRDMNDAKDHDWFWRKAADTWNNSHDTELNTSLSKDK